MDNTKKRKIVRNFVIGYLIIQVLTIEEFYKLKYCSTVVYMVPRA